MLKFSEAWDNPQVIMDWDRKTREDRFKELFKHSLRIAGSGNKDIITVLMAGLTMPEFSIYFPAAYILRYLTGENHGYKPFNSEEDRQMAYGVWMDWWRESKLNFKYNFLKLEQSTLIVDEIPGRLVGNDDEPPGRIFLLSKNGETLWETYKLKMPYDAAHMRNGSYLVNIIRARAVWKISTEGSVLRRIPVGGYPCSLELLKNGNLLVAGWDDNIPGFVREFDPDGETVWSMEDLCWPWKAQRLKNGNTLIADAGTNRVFEVNPAKEEVWSVGSLGPKEPELFDALGPVYCQRLDDGNTLVSIRGLSKIVELAPDGREVWKIGKDLLLNQYSAVRLWNGNTLIADGGHFRVIEVDVEKNIVWEKNGIGYPAKAYRY